ncbi:RNA polymerase sigma factor [Pedobacter sp. AJM]|uniref:RNA polymerase sigma factor n=1 Tax=Pedobacter sp. AJM TaxID=2003629 RepID=UPI000B4A9326|nr:sigma-70 family RNA polymerase sigma factor [Pedobacter sp. AJM]OWK69001.1 hypothetical protein CBW18_19075 [Pedobacter sp. AJM]
MAGKKEFSEQELLLRVAGGNQDTFRILYDQYQKSVYARALYFLKSDLLAEDVLQEVMLTLWKSAGKLKQDINIAAYLATLTRNRSFQLLRRQVLEAKTNFDLGKDWAETHNQTEEQILLSDTKGVLKAGIALLPPQQKLVYELCHQQGLKYEEAARELGLSKETVKSYMKLALSFLRRYISAHTDVAAILVILKLL